MNQVQETNTQSDATTATPVDIGPTDQTALPKIKLNRAQVRARYGQSKRSLFYGIRRLLSEAVKKARSKKRKVQRASRKRNRA